MVFGVFDPLFLARKSSITWGEEHKGVFGLSGSQLELRCVTPHSHRSGKNALSNLLYPRPWARLWAVDDSSRAAAARAQSARAAPRVLHAAGGREGERAFGMSTASSGLESLTGHDPKKGRFSRAGGEIGNGAA